VPTVTLVTVEPETVQIAVVPDVNTTGLPDAPPVADRVNVPPLNKTGVAGAKPVMVCAVRALAVDAANKEQHRAANDRNEVQALRARGEISIFLFSIEEGARALDERVGIF
jgi:hypothetical protein